jgi:hypothetical protein
MSTVDIFSTSQCEHSLIMFLEEESVHVCLQCGQHLPHYADCDAIVSPLTWSSLGSAGTHFMLGDTSDCDIYHHHHLLRRKEGGEEEEEEEEEEELTAAAAVAAAAAAATAREQRQVGIIAQAKELLERVGKNIFFSGCLVQTATENLNFYRHLMRTVEQGHAPPLRSLSTRPVEYMARKEMPQICALCLKYDCLTFCGWKSEPPHRLRSGDRGRVGCGRSSGCRNRSSSSSSRPLPLQPSNVSA